jgi:hypothetical protein
LPGNHVDQHGGDRFVELEERIADEAVADDDVNRSAIAPSHGEVAPLDVSLKVES